MKDNEEMMNLAEFLKANAPSNCVAIRLFTNSEGYSLNYEIRTPESLRRESITMKDVHGDWVK